jgi:WD40 repeat protein
MARVGWLMLLAAVALPSSAQDFRKLVTITTPVRIQRVSACGPSGLVAGLARTGSVYAWRLPSGELVSTRHAEDGISALACSPDGKWLAVGKRDGSVVITDISGTPARTLAVAKRRVDDLAFSPDGSLLAVNVNEAPVELWNPAQGTLVAALKTDFSGSTSMDFSPDGALLATADSDTSIRIYDRHGKLKTTYADLLMEPFAVSFLPNGTQVAIGGADGILTILDASDAHVVRQFPKQPDPVFGVVALPDGMSLLSVHLDAARLEKLTSILWDIRAGDRRDFNLPFDGAHVVGSTTAGRQWMVFTTDSDSSLTAWVFAN